MYVLFIFQYSYFDLEIRALNYVRELIHRIEKAKELQTKTGNKDMLNEWRCPREIFIHSSFPGRYAITHSYKYFHATQLL